MQEVLSILPRLDSKDLEDFVEQCIGILDQVRDKEDQELDATAKIEYKEISNSFCAYLREWGGNQELSNSKNSKSLGCAYFQPFCKYRLVNKKTGEEKVLASLGLWRLEEDKLYLIIQYVYPKNVLQKYLFLDYNLQFPAEQKAPQRLLTKHFAKKQWEYHCLGEVDNFDELGIARDTITFITSPYSSIPQVEILPVAQEQRKTEVVLVNKKERPQNKTSQLNSGKSVQLA